MLKRNIIFSFILSVILFTTAFSQETKKVDLGDGYIAELVTIRERNFSLIVFPSEKLEDLETFKSAIAEVLVKIFGCKEFKDCRPVKGGLGILEGFEDYKNYVFIDMTKKRIAIFPLYNNDDTQIIGISITLIDLPSTEKLYD